MEEMASKAELDWIGLDSRLRCQLVPAKIDGIPFIQTLRLHR